MITATARTLPNQSELVTSCHEFEATPAGCGLPPATIICHITHGSRHECVLGRRAVLHLMAGPALASCRRRLLAVMRPVQPGRRLASRVSTLRSATPSQPFSYRRSSVISASILSACTFTVGASDLRYCGSGSLAVSAATADRQCRWREPRRAATSSELMLLARAAASAGVAELSWPTGWWRGRLQLAVPACGATTAAAPVGITLLMVLARRIEPRICTFAPIIYLVRRHRFSHGFSHGFSMRFSIGFTFAHLRVVYTCSTRITHLRLTETSTAVEERTGSARAVLRRSGLRRSRGEPGSCVRVGERSGEVGSVAEARCLEREQPWQ